MLHHLLERNCVSSPPTARFASLNLTLSISSWTKRNPASNPFFINREEEQSPILPLSLSLSLSQSPQSLSLSLTVGGARQTIPTSNPKLILVSFPIYKRLAISVVLGFTKGS